MRKDVTLIKRTTPLPEIVATFLKSRSLFLYVGDDEGRLLGVVDIHQLQVAPTIIKLIDAKRAVLFDTEALADWERDGELSWKSGILLASRLSGRRAAWVKIEVPWEGAFRWRVSARDARGLEGLPSADGLIAVDSR